MAASLAAAAAVLMVSLAEIAAQSPMGGDMPMTLPDSNLTAFSLPPPPRLVGALAPNNWLSKAVKYMEGSVVGPESMVVVNGHVYTGTSTGYVMHFHPSTRRPRNEYPRPCGKPWRRVRPILRLSYTTCRRGSTSEAICGRPLGIRAGSDGNLIVVDAYKGIFKINPRTCQYQMLVNAHNVNNQGDHLHFLNDVTVAKNGLIFFTSSSDKYPRPKFMNIILEGDKSGRVMVYNPKTKLVTDVMRNLHFPNGLQLAKDESYLLVAEGARAKIHRIWLKGNRKGQVTTFADNLPGFVDNIRLSPRGTYWVAISSVRYHGRPGVLDQYGPQPRVRQLILSMPMDQIITRSPKYGMVVELNANGQPIRSLHDPSGVLYDAVSEVEEEKGLLFFGSYKNNFIGVLRMRVLPPPVEPPTQPVTTQAPPPVVPPPTTNPQVNFLNHVQTTIAQMSKERLRQIIMVLVQRFLEARLDSRRAVERANRLQQLLNEATQLKPSGTTGQTITTEFSGADTATDAPTNVVPTSWV